MMVANVLDIAFSNVTEEELSETVLLRLVQKEKLSIVFVNTKMFFHLIFNGNFRKIVGKYEFIVPSSGFISFILSKLTGTDFHKVKESSCLFRIVRKISDYNYRILLIGKNEKMVTKFKKNISSSIPSLLANIVGIYDIYNKKTSNKKLEAIRKIEPDIIIFGDRVIKHLKFFHKKREIILSSSLIFSSNGAKVISGIGFEREKILNFFTNLFEGFIIVLWFAYKKLSKFIEKRL